MSNIRLLKAYKREIDFYLLQFMSGEKWSGEGQVLSCHIPTPTTPP